MGDLRKLPGVGDGPEDIRRDLDSEIEAHLEMRAEELEAAGLAPDEARAEALRRFGDVEAARKEIATAARRRARRRWWTRALEEGRRDLVLATRQAKRSPGFTVLAVVVFALGVGLSTSMFTLTDHVLLRPLPFPHAERLVALGSVLEGGTPFYRVSMGNWVDWKKSPALASTALYRTPSVTVTGVGEAFRAPVAEVRGPFFQTLGVRMSMGRALREDDGQTSAPVTVVSSAFWRGRLGADPDVVGRTLELNGRPVEVVGVVAPGFGLPDDAELWLPFPWQPESGAMRNNINYVAVGRLAAGVSRERAREELSAIADGIREREPAGIYSWGVGAESLHRFVVGDVTPYLRLLMAAVLFVLLAACANLAGLGVARSRRRRQDMAVRLALGAGKGQLIRQILVEHVVLALLGGGLGVGLAWWVTGAVGRTASGLLPRAGEITFDGRIAAFGLVASLVAGILGGLLPAVRASAAGQGGLPGARGSVKGGRGLPGAVMVAVETSLAVALLVSGGLLLRSFLELTARDLGYDPTRVVTLDIDLTAKEYQDLGQRIVYWQSLMERERAIPGVQDVAVSDGIPTSDGRTSFIEIGGSDVPNPGAAYRAVSDDYFAVLGIPVRAGRTFGKADDAGTERVGVVNEAFARAFWPGQSAVGKHFRAPSMEAYFRGGTAPWIRVVGVVGDVREHSFESEPRPGVFVLYRQMPEYARSMTAAVKLRAGVSARVLQALRRSAHDLDPELAIEMRSLEARVHASLSERRLTLLLIGLFAAATVLLVSLGVYGLISFAVAERTREIAVRAALGLDRTGILSLMLGSAVRVALLGIVGGLLGAFVLDHLLVSMLVGVSVVDQASYASASLLLVAVTLAAALLPAMRASRLDPVEALRRE